MTRLWAIGLILGAGLVPPAVAEGLTEADFRQISDRGFGDRGNSYVWSTAWFRSKLYVGTNHRFACLTRAIRGEASGRNPEVPIECEPNLIDEDLRGRIYAYDPATNTVELVYMSPTVRVLVSDGSQADVAVDLGYRSMCVFRGRDGNEALYVGTFVTDEITGRPPRILRSTDGVNFTEVPGVVSNNPLYSSYRSLTVFKDRLYVIAIGRVGQETVLLEASNPAAGDFRVVNPPSFGDATNIGVFELAVFKGHLYVGTATASDGFQLLKTQAVGRPPYVFQKVLVKGAYRGPANQNVVSLQAYRDHLYVGSGINFLGLDFFPDVDPAAAELLRVRADDTWDIVCGDARDTSAGSKEPISGKDAGCNNMFAGYIWRMVEHEGMLYMGTFDLAVAAQYFENVTIDQLDRRGLFDLYPNLRSVFENLDPGEVGDVIAAIEGGFDLWSTIDGVEWNLVSRTGFGDQFSYGVRSFESTPVGLFLGTANPFFGFRLYLGQPPGLDSDGDGFADVDDNCPLAWNLSQADQDQDGIGDACDPDDDNDCIPDVDDPEPLVARLDLPDHDDDGVPDDCDGDDDNDSVPDRQDNCPRTASLFQGDRDADGMGDACDAGNVGTSDDDPDTDGDEPPGDSTDDDPGRPVTLPQPCGAVGIMALAFALLALHQTPRRRN